MKVTVSISDDERFLRLQVDKPETTLTAQDVENLISQLAALRERMNPSIGQARELSADGHLVFDALLPETECVLEARSRPLVVLAIGFQGLGWRNVALSVEQSAALGKELLAYSARGRA